VRNTSIHRTILRDFRLRFKRYKYRSSLPVELRNNDVFIVEYPKSGITWLCTLIVNYLHMSAGSDSRASLFNVNQFIQGVHVDRGISDYILPNMHGRLIKSHSEYNPFYNNVIYLLRNPVSVMESYYQYCIDLSVCDMSYEDFIRSKKFGVGKWKAHVESWLLRDLSPAKIHLIKYEDLVKSASCELRELFWNLGVPVNEDQIEMTVNVSSLESMRRSQSLYSKHNPAFSVHFVRKNNVKFESNAESKEYIIDECRDLLERFYPQILTGEQK